MVTQAKLKWKRLAPGKYSAEVDGRTVFCERMYNWRLYLDGGYAIGDTFSTLAAAKGCVHVFWSELLAKYDARQKEESAKRLAASAKVREQENRDRALRAPIYDPQSGVSWFDWAEVYVGCTAAQVRAVDTRRDKRMRRFLRQPLTNQNN